MLKTISLNTFLFFITIVANSQSNFDYFKYRQHYNNAKIAMADKKYPEARAEFEKSFTYGNSYLPDNLDLEDYASCLLALGDTTATMEALKKSVMKGTMPDDMRLVKKISKDRWNKFLADCPDLIEERWRSRSAAEIENIMQIIKIDAIDQAVRNNFDGRIPKEIFNKLMKITDSINFYDLKKLVVEKGANPNSFLMMHLYGENEKYVPFYDSILKKGIFEGKTSPEMYVFWYDRQRIYVEEKKTQVYGEFNLFDHGDENYSPNLNPIEDIKNVDKRRAEIGLMSVEESAKVKGGALPDEYIKMKAQMKAKK